jgi:hypothetical protein
VTPAVQHLPSKWEALSSIPSTIFKKAWAGDFAQVVEHLPSKQKALSSNTSITKKKKKKENKNLSPYLIQKDTNPANTLTLAH